VSNRYRVGKWFVLSVFSSAEVFLWRLLVWRYVEVFYDVDVAVKLHLRIPEV